MKNGRNGKCSDSFHDAEKEHSELVKTTYVHDYWLILHFLAIFGFSMVVGLIVTHATMIMHQWQYGYSFFTYSSSSLEHVFKNRVIKQYGQAGLEQFESLAKYGVMKVNTSLYVK